MTAAAPIAGATKRGVATYAGLNVAESVAWLLYVWVLAQLLPSTDLGRVLHALVFSACVGAILTVGWKSWLLDAATRPDADSSLTWSAAVAGLATRCMIALPVMVLISGQVGGKVLFPWPEMPVLIAILSGLFALLRLAGFWLCARGEPATAALLRGALPVLLALAAVMATAEARPISFDLVLGLHALCLLVPLVLALRRMPALRWGGDLPVASVFPASVAQSGAVLFRNVDVLVIGLVLSPVEAAVYLIARGVAMLLDLLFRVLARALADPMAHSLEAETAMLFVAQAARANLGFLLIGGAGALFLFLTIDPMLGLFGISAVEGRQVMIWLIVAQSAPAIFGATHLVLSLTKLDGLRAWVVWPALPLALVMSFSAARDGIASLAMAYATLQIAMAAAAAVIVALRCGIWPGLTAMFHKGIRLR